MSSQRTGSGSRLFCAVLVSRTPPSDGFPWTPLATFLRIISIYLSPCGFICPAPLLHPFPFLPAAPRVHLDMHTYAHMHIFSPPLSPCGFKVLILIRFALTYCQSSFSCSSEALGSYHQDLDLGPKPCWPVHIGSPWTENKRSFASLLPMKVSPQFSSCLFKIKN